MPFRLRFVSNPNPEKFWYERDKSMQRWKFYYRPPWVLLIHLLEIIVLFIILFRLIFPNVRDSFLIRSMFAQKLSFDIDLNVPISRVSDVADFIDNFNDNLDDFINGSFMHIFYANPDKPYDFIITWINGTTTSFSELAITTELFRHISKLRVETYLYYVLPRSEYKGCTKWDIATEIVKSEGSYTFYAAPYISRDHCPDSFMKQISYPTNRSTFYKQKINEFNQIKFKAIYDKNKLNKHIQLFDSDLVPLLPDERLPQSAELENLAGCLVILSIAGTIALSTSLYHRWKNHIKWRANDPMYRDLEVYEQIHHSLGFWHPLHLIMEIILFATSIVLLDESQHMTQFLSIRSIHVFAVGFFLTVCIAPRWFILWPNVYQVVLIIRVAFTRLVSTFIGLLPIICAFMMLAVFLFGLVSDITKNYYRYLQLFFGLVFGDDTYNIFSYFSDGTLLYDILSLFFTMFIALLAGYIFFPAFTATISFLRSKEVLVIQQKDSENN